jgi:hypothetical protein
MGTTKSLQTEHNERIRRELRAWIDKEFQGNASAAASSLGLSQSLVSEFLGGARGAGPKLINAFASKSGRSIDDLYGRPPTGSKVIRLGDRADWPMAREEARSRAAQRRLTDADIARVAGVMLDDPPAALTGEAVLRLAEALLYVPTAAAKAS